MQTLPQQSNAYYANNKSVAKARFDGIKDCVALAVSLGLEPHAGHGLDYKTAAKVASIIEIKELNIGLFIIGESLIYGLSKAVKNCAKR